MGHWPLTNNGCVLIVTKRAAPAVQSLGGPRRKWATSRLNRVEIQRNKARCLLRLSNFHAALDLVQVLLIVESTRCRSSFSI